MSDERSSPGDIHVPEGRDRLGRAHQLRVDISIAISMAPAWLRRALGDRDAAKARGARIEFVERIAHALERRFRITWIDVEDEAENARPADCASPLFGGPEAGRERVLVSVDDRISKEHKVNDIPDGVVERP